MEATKKSAGDYAYSGSCAPGSAIGSYETFSLGVFQWQPKSSGKGVKRGPVVVRVVGRTSHPELAYAKAKEVVEQLTAGVYGGPKRVQAFPTSSAG